MLITTFNEEGVINPTDLILKSLSILAFLCPSEDTNTKIQYHENRYELERLRYNETLSKFVFICLVNPPGYTMVTKNHCRPQDRKSINEDFLLVEEHSLYEYLQVVKVISNTYSMN